MQSKISPGIMIIAIMALVGVILSGVALTKNRTQTGNPDTLSKIISSKTMDVCVAEWPPASIKDAKTSKYSGHDIEAYEMIAKEIGATVRYHDTTFGNMPAALQSGVCDMGTSLFVKISRSAAVDFTRPILYGGDSGLVRKGDTRFRTKDDLNKPSIKIAVANGESGHIFAKTYLDKATIIPIDVEASDLSRFMLEVTSGRADVAIADSNMINRFAAAHPETQVIFSDHPLDLNPDAFPVRLGDVQLLHFLDNSILSLQTSGEWDRLEKKYNAHWFHEDTPYKLK